MKFFLTMAALAALLISPAFAQESGSFASWLEDFKKDAREQGISQETLDDAFASTELIDRVLVLDKKQPENVFTLDQYLNNVVTPKRIREGREFYADNRALLKKISKEYDVQPQYIMALWGIETNFGRNTGGFETIDALATLAYDGRRSEFFRAELINALKILEAEHMPAADMKGSWAGALGQCQFMPTSFLKFAVDYDKDGHRDIWNSEEDVFASIANYLHSEGWNDNEGWGREVRLPDNFDRALADIKQEKTVAEWKKLGVRKVDGRTLPSDNTMASVIFVGTGDDEVPYIIYKNYKVILKWNRSRFFATAVGELANKIAQ